MTAPIKIKHIYGGVLYEYTATSVRKSMGLTMRAVLEAATSAEADLCGADLRGADLHGADLHGADLHGADLHGADLHGADLRGADLYGADLRGADLRGADLYGAELSGKKLSGEQPVITIGPIGSRSDYLTAYITDVGVWIKAGCFFNTIDEFREKLEAEHGENPHGKEYRAALVLIEVHATIWTPAEATA